LHHGSPMPLARSACRIRAATNRVWSQDKYYKIVSEIPSQLAPILNTNTRLLMQPRWQPVTSERRAPRRRNRRRTEFDRSPEILDVVVSANGSPDMSDGVSPVRLGSKPTSKV